jgi:hypothetical protein
MNKLFCAGASIAFVVWIACASPAQAMSYVPMTDAALLAEADAVVVGTITGAGPLSGRELLTTAYVVQPLQFLKGLLALAPVTIEVPGAFDSRADGAATVPGAPRFAVGDRVTLFLRKLGDGHYAIAEQVLGAFTVGTTVSGTPVLVRDLSEANDACGSCAAEPERAHRELGKFGAWALAQASGQPADGQYWNSEPLAPRLEPRFITASPLSRWFQFADGSSVPFYAGSTGQQGMLDGGYLEFQTAILAWNLNLGSNINYFFAGLTNASGGLSRQDGVNEILFNDPNDELNGSFNCLTGGVLAYTVFFTSGSGTFNNQTFQRINESHIVVRKGSACFLTGHLDTDATEVFGHELGHSLGLAHPCGDPGKTACVPGSPQDAALMRPTMHADGRGASLGSDDQAGAAYLYARGVNNGPTSGDGPTARSGSPGSSGGGGGSWDAMALGMLLCLSGLRHWRPRPATAAHRGGRAWRRG